MMKVPFSLQYMVLFLPAVFFSACEGNGAENNENNEIDIPSWLNERVLDFENENDLTPLIDAMDNRELILLGEASHGTHEYYFWRSRVNQKLIEEQDMNFIAVEGDWSAVFELNKYVKDLPDAGESAREIQQQFDRWPEWLWANEVIEDFAEWLREYNIEQPMNDRVGIYGMDVYGHYDAIQIVEEFTEKFLPGRHEEVLESYECIKQFDHDDWAYAQAVARGGEGCRDETRRPYEILENYRDRLLRADRNAFLHAHGAALVAKNAEDYYRKAPQGGEAGWNSRASHFYEAVKNLQNFYGDESRGTAWAHNTHIGDARATQMADQRRHNIGQLAREDMEPDNVFALGFSTYQGKVKAGTEWGSPGQIMDVPSGIGGSIENIFNQTGRDSFLWLIDDEARQFEPLNNRMGHRAIGVTYNPAVEHRGNYVPTIVPERYDAMIFIRETNELQPIN